MKAAKKVIVIGGGASGIMAAIIAARNGANVIILERMNRVGKKILATGNGRCNLTNMYIDIQRFHGKNPNFAYAALSRFDVKQTIDFFESLGVACKEEEGGKVYPFSDQASSVLDVLRYELSTLGVEERCGSEVERILPNKNGFSVILKDGIKINGERVIIATGGKASPNLGSNGSGYSLAEALGHTIISPMPALVQLKLNASFLKALKGVKFIGEASIESGKKTLRKERGEILFTDYGISGPPILQLSRKANELLSDKSTPWIVIDMFPDLEENELYELLKARFENNPTKPLDFSFVGLLNKRLIPVVLKEAGIKSLQIPCKQVTNDEINNIIKILKYWKIEITGTQSWMSAQVTAGGINVKEVNPQTMESKLVKGLYFCGEVLDIDGDCGGFNLQWAWSSGYVAGIHSALD
jgi:predicted Rossmann fold flavoprotein